MQVSYIIWQISILYFSKLLYIFNQGYGFKSHRNVLEFCNFHLKQHMVEIFLLVSILLILVVKCIWS